MATEEDKLKLKRITDKLYYSSADNVRDSFDNIESAVEFLERFKGVNPGLDFSLACIKDYRKEMQYFESMKKLTKAYKHTFNHKMKLIADHAKVIDLKKYPEEY